MKASFLAVIAALAASALTGPTQALPIGSDLADQIRFIGNTPIPSGYEAVVTASFARTGEVTRFELSGDAFASPLEGSCKESIANTGATSIACSYGSNRGGRSQQVTVTWSPDGSQAEGTISMHGSRVTVMRETTEADGAVWRFRQRGRDVALLGRDGLEVTGPVTGATHQALTAASMILQVLG